MVRKETAEVGGRLCLDFVNTVSWRGSGEPRDHLLTFDDLVRWARRAGAIDAPRARAVRRLAARHPRRAAKTLLSAHRLRDAIYRILLAWKSGRAPSPSDIRLLNASAPARAGVRFWRGEAEWLTGRTPELASMLWPIVWSAGDVLVGGERKRLKSCGSEECGWLFYDESRGKRRRWCSMSDCGNRAKARRFYARSVKG